jgi:hypothetical protein
MWAEMWAVVMVRKHGTRMVMVVEHMAGWSVVERMAGWSVVVSHWENEAKFRII